MAIDPNLISACRKGEEKAIYQLYKLCFSDLMAICVRYHNSDHDSRSALNKGFLKIVQNLEKYKSNVPWVAWIKRIMINTIINDYKANQKKKEVFVAMDFVENPIPDWNTDEINEQLDADHLKAMVNNLPVAQKQVFNLYAIDGYTHKEIAEILEIPLGTSKWLLSGARKSLKDQISASLKTKLSIPA